MSITELQDTMRGLGWVAWSRPPAGAEHLHIFAEPRRRPGQTARRYRQQRRAWARFQAWQRKQSRRFA